MKAEARVDRPQAERPLVLSIDVGTSSARARVYDALGRMVGDLASQHPYSVRVPEEGAAEIDPNALLELVLSCVDEVLSRAGAEAGEIKAVACDTFWHGLMGVSRAAEALTPVYTWADTRSGAAAVELRGRLDENRVHAATGAGLHSSYLPAKLLWLYESQSSLVRKVDDWMSFAEYLYLRLFGVRRVSVSMASATGLFNQRSCTWDEDVLAALPIKADQLSPIADTGEPLDRLSQTFARRWPALSKVPWYLPLGDGACNNVGSGGIGERRWVVMIGTSGALRVVRETEDFDVPAGLWSYRVDRRRIVQGGALSDGGNVYAWLLQTLRIDATDDLEERLEKMPPDSHHLTVLPFLAGERSPDWNPDARAAFVGMGLDTKPVDIVRAALEAVALRFGLVYRVMKEALREPESIIGSGAGLVQSPAWMRIVTDVLGRPVVASAVAEATSRGAALLALEALGVLESVEAAPVPLGERREPIAKHHEAYDRALARQEKLYDLLVRPADGIDTVKSAPARTETGKDGQ